LIVGGGKKEKKKEGSQKSKTEKTLISSTPMGLRSMPSIQQDHQPASFLPLPPKKKR